MNKVLNLLGLARKAGKLTTGTDAVCDNLKHNKFYLIFVASDASTATMKKIENKGMFYNIPIIKSFTSEELSIATGSAIKVVAVTDLGFTKAINKILEKVERENN